MTIAEQIKIETLAMRKAKHPLASFMSFVISEVDKIGKDAGNRATTDDEAISVLKKLIEKNKQIIEHSSTAEEEIYLLQKFMPKMLSTGDIQVEVDTFMSISPDSNKGALMKYLKSKFGSTIDLKFAGTYYDSRS